VRFYEGPVSLYFERREAASSSSCHSLGRDEEGYRRILALLERTAGAPLRIEGLLLGGEFRLQLPIAVRRLEPARVEAEGTMRDAVDAWESWLDAAVVAGRLDRAKREQLPSPFRVEVIDQRSNQSTSLPEFAVPKR
jgi:hypothetical protein